MKVNMKSFSGCASMKSNHLRVSIYSENDIIWWKLQLPSCNKVTLNSTEVHIPLSGRNLILVLTVERPNLCASCLQSAHMSWWKWGIASQRQGGMCLYTLTGKENLWNLHVSHVSLSLPGINFASGFAPGVSMCVPIFSPSKSWPEKQMSSACSCLASHLWEVRPVHCGRQLPAHHLGDACYRVGYHWWQHTTYKF